MIEFIFRGILRKGK